MKIGRNEPCWCGSGKKYKKCHYLRSTEEPIKPFEVDKKMKNEYQKEYCCAPEAIQNECSGNIVKAHSISKKSTLLPIAKDGHVYGFTKSIQNLFRNGGRIKLEKIGIQRASIFTGFCSTHDDKIFKPIESGCFNESKKECFLYSYRALCKEFFTKKASLGLKDLKSRYDAGKSEDFQKAYQIFNSQHQLGLGAGMNDLLFRKMVFDEIFLSDNYEKMGSFIIKFNAIPSIVASGGKNLIYDFNGNFLQDATDLSKIPSAVFYNYFSRDSDGYVIFSWLKDNSNVATKFIESLKEIEPRELTNALIRFIFSACENLFISPDWWENLEISKQENLMNRINSVASPFEGYTSDYLKDDSIYFDDWKFSKFIEL